MKAKLASILAIACLVATAGCSHSGGGDGQDVKPKVSVQAAAVDSRIPPEKQAEIQQIMAQQNATQGRAPAGQ